MKSIRLEFEMPDKEVDELAGLSMDKSYYYQLITESTNVYKPNGDIWLVFKKNIILNEQCLIAQRNLRRAAVSSENRGIAGGIIDEDKIRKLGIEEKIGKFRYKPKKSDGSKSNTTYANPVNSGIIGYYDRYPIIPYCRLTAFI